LLTRLQKADYETWERIARGIPLKPCGECFIFRNGEITACQFKDLHTPFGELLPEVAEAWLQHVLQDAIRAKGWQGIVLFSDDSNRAVIDGPDTGFGYRHKLAEGIGNSPANALTKAYLAAWG